MKNPSFYFLLTVSILFTLLYSSTIFAMDPKEATNQVILSRKQGTGSRGQVRNRNQIADINLVKYCDKTNNQQLTPFFTMNPEEISEAENAFGFSERKTARVKIPMETTIRPLSKLAYADEVQGACTLTPKQGSYSLPSPTAVAVPTAYSLQPIASIQPIGRLGDFILSLPSGIIWNFLRSPEPKLTAYKTEHEQAIQELQVQYPNLAEKIAVWKNVVEGWSECRFPEEQEACYQNVVALASEMPPELYRLVALSQAMKIMEDAKAYSYYLPRAFEQYDKDAETEEARKEAKRSKTILLAQIDIINNNILKLEKVADAIIRLSEQRNRCFIAADAVAGTLVSKIKIHSAAILAEKAIASYLQFAQKMKEGDASVASKFRMEGLYSEFDALKQEYHAKAESNNNFENAALRTVLALELLRNVVQARGTREVEVAKAYEQAAVYQFQAVQATAHSDNTKDDNFSAAYYKAKDAAKLLKEAAQAKAEGKIEVAKAYELAARYHLQAAEIVANGDTTNAENFSNAALQTVCAALSLKKVAQARNDKIIETAEAFEQAVNYQFQAAQAAENGDTMKVEDFSNAALRAASAALSLKNAAQAMSKGQEEATRTFKQAACCHFQAAQANANGNNTNAENFSRAARNTDYAAEALKNVSQARAEGQEEAAIVLEQAAQYYLQATQSAVLNRTFHEQPDHFIHCSLLQELSSERLPKAFEQTASYHFQSAIAACNGNNMKAKYFFNAARQAIYAAEPLKNATQARSEGQEETAKAYEQAALYHFQAAQVAAQGDSTSAENFSSAGYRAADAAEVLKKIAQARSEGKVEVAKAYEVAVLRCFQAARSAANGDKMRAEKLSTAARIVVKAASFLNR